MRISKRLVATVLSLSMIACSTSAPSVSPVAADIAGLCGACPSPSDVFTEDGENPIELVTSYFDIDAEACVYATLYGEYTQPVLCPAAVEDPAESVSAFVALFTCDGDTCGCTDGMCPITPTTTTLTLSGTTDGSGSGAVTLSIVWDLAKYVGSLTKWATSAAKVVGAAKLICILKAGLKAAKTAATALAKAGGHSTQLKALLTTYPTAASRTPQIVGQIQQEAWMAAANYARSAAAARLALKKGSQAVGTITAAWAGGQYIFGSKEADTQAKTELEDGMKDTTDTLAAVQGDILDTPLPDDVKATQRGRLNRSIQETQNMLDELNKKAQLCDDEKDLKAVLEELKADLIKKRDGVK